MVEIMFPEIRASSKLLEKMLSIRVLECFVTRDDVQIYGRTQVIMYIMSQEMKHCLYYDNISINRY